MFSSGFSLREGGACFSYILHLSPVSDMAPCSTNFLLFVFPSWRFIQPSRLKSRLSSTHGVVRIYEFTVQHLADVHLGEAAMHEETMVFGSRPYDPNHTHGLFLHSSLMVPPLHYEVQRAPGPDRCTNQTYRTRILDADPAANVVFSSQG